MGTTKLVDLIDISGQPVVVHCSDGWDRTAQICSLAQVCLDPYYRTIKGLEVLIEKEWLSFGHKFHQRIGHGNKNHSDDQRSPIFLQFMDALWQIMQQMECAFEYNEAMLITTLDALYSCKFGTFLCNSEKERVEHRLRERTTSLWSFINSNVHQFTNHLYEPAPYSLRPSSETQQLKLWTAYYMRSMLAQKRVVKDEYILQPHESGDAARFSREVTRREMNNLKMSNSSMANEIAQLRAELEKMKASPIHSIPISPPASHPPTTPNGKQATIFAASSPTQSSTFVPTSPTNHNGRNLNSSQDETTSPRNYKIPNGTSSSPSSSPPMASPPSSPNNTTKSIQNPTSPSDDKVDVILSSTSDQPDDITI